jgi:hypothetical protein
MNTSAESCASFEVPAQPLRIKSAQKRAQKTLQGVLPVLWLRDLWFLPRSENIISVF